MFRVFVNKPKAEKIWVPKTQTVSKYFSMNPTNFSMQWKFLGKRKMFCQQQQQKTREGKGTTTFPT